MKTLLTLSIWMCFLAGLLQAQTPANTFTRERYKDRKLVDLIAVSDGFLVLGWRERVEVLDNHRTTYCAPFVAKMDRGLQIVWETKLNESLIPAAKGLAFDGKTIYIASNQSDLKTDVAVLIKLDTEGNWIGEQVFRYPGYHSSSCYAMRVLPDGGMLVFAEAFRTHSSAGQPWLICLNANGEMAWSKFLAQPCYYGWINDAIPSSDGHILVSVSSFKDNSSMDAGKFAGFLQKFDRATGKVIWEKNLSAYGNAVFSALVEGADGRITAVGCSTLGDQRPLLFMRFDANGASGKELKMKSLSDGSIHRFIPATSGNIVSYLAQGSDAKGQLRLSRVDAQGNTLAEFVAGRELVVQTVITHDGEIIVVCRDAILRGYL